MGFVKLNRGPLLVGITITSLLFASVAAAAGKVVVVPINSSNVSGGKFVDGVNPDDAVYTLGKVGIGTLEPGSELEVNGSITFSDGVPTVTSLTGQVWMDRNLGALRVATKSADPDAYGSLYQWGRSGGGHEYRTSPTTETLSNTQDHGYFMLSPTLPYDWRITSADALWASESSPNNPCPAGFRLPTEAEWEIEHISWSSNNSAGAFASPLKLVVAGNRAPDNAGIYYAGSTGYYWSSSVNDSYSRLLYVTDSTASMNDSGRASGCSVRCLKD